MFKRPNIHAARIIGKYDTDVGSKNRTINELCDYIEEVEKLLIIFDDKHRELVTKSDDEIITFYRDPVIIAATFDISATKH